MNEIVLITLFEDHLSTEQPLITALKKEEDVVLFTTSFFKKPKKLFYNKKDLLFQEIICFCKLISKIWFFKNKKILCFGGHFSFLFLNKLFGKFSGKNFHLYLYNFYLHSMGEKAAIKKILRFLLNSDRVTLMVQSPEEVEYYTPLARNKVFFVPYCEDESVRIEDFPLDVTDYFFSGGYTNRDYPLLFQCAQRLPQQKFVFVASKLNLVDFPQAIPFNVFLYYDLKREFFYSLMSRAKCVIIPLKENVGASGQMLSLGAIKLKKPVIYCDVSSINYYFNQSGCAFPYKINNLDSLVEAVELFLTKTVTELKMGADIAFENYSENFTIRNRNKMIRDFVISKNIPTFDYNK